MGYWENRQAQMMYEYMEDAEAVSKELADIYAKASRHLAYKMDMIFEKFRDRHDLTDEEAKRLLNILKDKTDIEKLKIALKNDPKSAKLLAEMESAAYRARIENLEQLQNEVDFVMQNVYKQEQKITTSHYINLAADSYYHQIYNIQAQAGFQFRFAAVDPKAIDLVLKSKWSGENYSSRIWKNTLQLAKDVKEQLLLGLITGKTEGEMAKEITEKYATGAFEARRLVRTESNFINGQMQLAAYQECGAEKYKFVAVLDLRTSKICRSLDGKVFDIKDAKVGVNLNPMHPFCRSTTTIYLDNMVMDGLKRIARNPETGKNEYVPANMNYQEWYEKNVANNPKAQAAEKSIRNKKADTALYEKYKKIYGTEEVGKNLEEFQQMKYTDSEKWEKLKAEKQRTINNLSDKKITGLNGKLSNQETRLWYKNKDEQIPNLLDKTKSLEEQARTAHDLRNQYRTQARDLMKDQKVRGELDKSYPNLTWEQMLDRKKEKYNLTGDAAYEDIVRSSTTTNKRFDEKAGVQ